MSSLAFEVMSGKRRNSKVLYVKDEKQFYIRKSEAKGRIYYTCYVKTCKSRVTLENGLCRKAPDFVEHDHSDQCELHAELKALNQIKEQCSDIANTLGAPSAVSGIRENFRKVCAR